MSWVGYAGSASRKGSGGDSTPGVASASFNSAKRTCQLPPAELRFGTFTVMAYILRSPKMRRARSAGAVSAIGIELRGGNVTREGGTSLAMRLGTAALPCPEELP